MEIMVREGLVREGLAMEELEAQPMGLLPDRVEMRRRRRRRGIRVTQVVDVANTNDNTGFVVTLGLL